MASGDGGKPGQWSARKAQLVAQKYESAGGGYSGAKTEGQKSLSKWTDQKWTTSDGKPAERKGGTTRYLPEKAWDKLSPGERAATNAKKREGSRKGEQFVKNTEAAAEARKEAVYKFSSEMSVFNRPLGLETSGIPTKHELAALRPHLNDQDYSHLLMAHNKWHELNPEAKHASESGAWQRSEGKNPEGGLNAKGRASLKAQGHDIKPGVKGPADTPEKMKRKGSFLSRMFGPGAPGSMKKDNGEPSRRALSAKAWGEPVPSDDAGRARLYAKGQALLKRYEGKKEAMRKEAIQKHALSPQALRILTGAAVGTTAGALGGRYLTDPNDEHRTRNTLLGGAAGGVIGALGGQGYHMLRSPRIATPVARLPSPEIHAPSPAPNTPVPEVHGPHTPAPKANQRFGAGGLEEGRRPDVPSQKIRILTDEELEATIRDRKIIPEIANEMRRARGMPIPPAPHAPEVHAPAPHAPEVAAVNQPLTSDYPDVSVGPDQYFSREDSSFLRRQAHQELEQAKRRGINLDDPSILGAANVLNQGPGKRILRNYPFAERMVKGAEFAEGEPVPLVEIIQNHAVKTAMAHYGLKIAAIDPKLLAAAMPSAQLGETPGTLEFKTPGGHTVVSPYTDEVIKHHIKRLGGQKAYYEHLGRTLSDLGVNTDRDIELSRDKRVEQQRTANTFNAASLGGMVGGLGGLAVGHSLKRPGLGALIGTTLGTVGGGLIGRGRNVTRESGPTLQYAEDVPELYKEPEHVGKLRDNLAAVQNQLDDIELNQYLDRLHYNRPYSSYSSYSPYRPYRPYGPYGPYGLYGSF